MSADDARRDVAPGLYSTRTRTSSRTAIIAYGIVPYRPVNLSMRGLPFPTRPARYCRHSICPARSALYVPIPLPEGGRGMRPQAHSHLPQRGAGITPRKGVGECTSWRIPWLPQRGRHRLSAAGELDSPPAPKGQAANRRREAIPRRE